MIDHIIMTALVWFLSTCKKAGIVVPRKFGEWFAAWFGNFRWFEFCAWVGGSFEAGTMLASKLHVHGPAANVVGYFGSIIVAAAYIRNPKSMKWDESTATSSSWRDQLADVFAKPDPDTEQPDSADPGPVKPESEAPADGKNSSS